ncbi:MAG: HAD family phosphatase [Roseburia sp.]|nr:HAD family phosphatase [Roseburia sp.]
MVKNIIFDIGNVLADFRWEAFLRDKGFNQAMVERIGRASVLSPLWYEFDKGVLSDEEVVESFVQRDPEIGASLHLAFDRVEGMVVMREYAIPWIKQLKAEGYGVWYLSNFSHKAKTQCPDSLSFLPLMDGGILSYQEKLVKPNPQIYRRLLSRYGLKAEECVFLDDTPINVEAARREGIYGIVFRNRQQAEEELRALGEKA